MQLLFSLILLVKCFVRCSFFYFYYVPRQSEVEEKETPTPAVSEGRIQVCVQLQVGRNRGKIYLNIIIIRGEQLPDCYCYYDWDTSQMILYGCFSFGCEAIYHL